MGYFGLFLSAENSNILIEKSLTTLENIVRYPHVTLLYNQLERKSVPEMGNEYEIIIIGHGIDTNNQGFLVKLPNSLKKYLNKDSKPHITVSLSSDGKAVDTKKLTFQKITPFNVIGKFGFFDGVSIKF